MASRPADAGIQAQTAECLVVSELVTDALIVVLNKVDLLPEEQRDRLVAKARKRLAATFGLTKFKGCAMVPVAAKPGASVGSIVLARLPVCLLPYKLVVTGSASPKPGRDSMRQQLTRAALWRRNFAGIPSALWRASVENSTALHV